MRALVVLFAALLGLGASAGHAQTGWIEGTVTDGEKAIGNAKILLPIRPIGMPIDLSCPDDFPRPVSQP